MLDFWAETVAPRSQHAVKIYVINDLEPEWSGQIRLRLMRGDECLSSRSVSGHVKGYGREIVTINLDMPADEGPYTLVAELATGPGTPVRSLRDFRVVGR